MKCKWKIINDEAFLSLANGVKDEINCRGRLLIRASGTEPKIRITVESESMELCKKYINTLTSFLQNQGYTDE